ncbi:hypothetical protein CISIN_1g0032232mg, partial [Citrus sinensis]
IVKEDEEPREFLALLSTP